MAGLLRSGVYSLHSGTTLLRNGSVEVAASGAVAPAVVTHPPNQSVAEGATATFTAAFSGSPAPTLQWQRNGSNISGATSASYTTPATTVGGGSANNGDQYRCVATNASGSVTTNAATLTVVAGGDTTRPVWSVGSPAITLVGGTLTTTGAQLGWDAATDANGVQYLISTDGGTTLPITWPSNNYTFSGLSPGTTYPIRVKAVDPSGNETLTTLSYSLTTLSAAVPYFDLSNAVAYTFKRRGDGVVMASTAVTFWVHNPTTGALVCTITGLSTNASGLVPVVSHASMALATQYRVNYEFAGGEFGVAKLTTAAS
ncbi:MAG: hypothetical protein RJA10_48 [Pseudomonadota bacterium]|jgi:hypothetical protein